MGSVLLFVLVFCLVFVFFICLRLRLFSNVFCVSGLFLRVPRTFIYIYRSPPLSLIRTEQVDETIGICLTDVLFLLHGTLNNRFNYHYISWTQSDGIRWRTYNRCRWSRTRHVRKTLRAPRNWQMDNSLDILRDSYMFVFLNNSLFYIVYQHWNIFNRIEIYFMYT